MGKPRGRNERKRMSQRFRSAGCERRQADGLRNKDPGSQGVILSLALPRLRQLPSCFAVYRVAPARALFRCLMLLLSEREALSLFPALCAFLSVVSTLVVSHNF